MERVCEYVDQRSENPYVIRTYFPLKSQAEEARSLSRDRRASVGTKLALLPNVTAANWALRTPSSAAAKGHGHGRRWSAARWPLPAGGG
jgi:hypothetical protein